MWNAGLGDCHVWLKGGIDPEGEVIPHKVSDFIDQSITAPCVLLFENPRSDSAYRIGLQNQRFSKGSVRYVAHEIRAAMMSMLEVREKDTICIISGESIAVEAAMSASEGAVIAVEYNDGDRASMEENVNKFGLNNVHIIPDMKPETLRELPVPTTAFIVADANLESEIQALLSLNPNMRFMIYTLELNVLAEIPSLFAKYQIQDMEALQIAVSKLRKNGMFETKPVPWIISGQAKA
jgi:precorrin-6Y C5,15-methyltransferase (decarboxylating)